jgi:DNA-binding MarR family transcriptional regulator
MYELSAGTHHHERPSLGTPLDRVLGDLRPVLRRAVDDRWPAAPLSPSQARLLRIVHLRPGIATRDVPGELREDPRVAGSIIDELVHQELLTRESDPGDHGRQGLRLTMKGRLRNRDWRGKSTEVLDHALDTLRPQERAAIAIAIPALERLADALSALRS